MVKFQRKAGVADSMYLFPLIGDRKWEMENNNHTSVVKTRNSHWEYKSQAAGIKNPCREPLGSLKPEPPESRWLERKQRLLIGHLHDIAFQGVPLLQLCH